MSTLPSLETVLAEAALPAGSHLSRVVDAEAARIALVDAEPAPSRVPQGRFEQALRDAKSRDGGAVIAEFKRASPSLGAFAIERDFATQLQAYRSGGAAAVSILAEPALFQGSASDVAAGEAYGLPRLYKGFVLDARHLDEAVRAGADAVLLIVRVLRGHTAAFAAAARARGLEPLVELHALEEIDHAQASGASLIGINARDLASFAIGSPTAEPLRKAFPGAVLIRESGLANPADARAAFAQGFDAVLIGEALMRSDDPATFIQDCRACP